MDLKDSKKAGLKIALFGVGFVAGYYIYSYASKQLGVTTTELPTLPPSLRFGMGSSSPTMPSALPDMEVAQEDLENLEMAVTPDMAPAPVVVVPPTAMELAQANPEGVTNALLLMI